MILMVTMLVPVLVAVYTVNYGRWAWKQNLRLGAVGLFLLAALTVAAPGFAIWRSR